MATPDTTPRGSIDGPRRILVGVQSEGNARLLRELLADQSLVVLADAAASDVAGPSDLVIVDGPTLAQHRDTLVGWRATSDPVVLPVLLIVDTRNDAGRDALERELGHSVDDILPVPATRRAVRARIDNLLRLRALSLQQHAQLQRTSEALDGASRALRTLHAGNAVLVRATEEQGLVEALCRVIVEQEHYPLAWVGFVEGGDDAEIVPAASAGATRDYLDGWRLTYATYANGPAWQAIERGLPVVQSDLQADPSVRSLHDRMRAHGLAGVLTLPITPRKGPAGVLAIYSNTAGEFQQDEREVLERLAGNLEYGIDALRTHQERERQRAAIQDLAYSDTLTWLPNRNYLIERLDQLLTERPTGERFAVFFIDLDDFKRINDALGHVTGDAVLRQIGHRLQQVIRADDLVARHGGDEFIVVMIEQPRSDEWQRLGTDYDGFVAAAKATGRRLTERLAEPLIIENREHRVGASIGFAVYPEHGETARELINGADTAMYAAKSDGTNVRAYDHAIASTQQRRLSMETRLYEALEHGELTVHYQPLFELDSGAIIGVEALARWPQEDGSFISPGEFIPLAEETGLITPLGDWVLRTALTQRAAWAESGLDLAMSVNVSVQQLQQPASAGCFLTASDHPVDASRVELEVTESGLLDESGTIREVLQRLHDRGFRIAVDDFGTGQSSLSRLQAMPIHTLKIDKAFIAGLDVGGDGAMITRAVHQLADGLGARSLAEGVETDAQRRELLELGCRVGQGFWLSGALPQDQLIALVRDQRRRGIVPEAERAKKASKQSGPLA
jgi:diguanylate cyclase (GGDEF)-like protein